MARTKRADKAAKDKEQRKAALALLDMPDDGWDEEDPGHRPYIKKDKRGRNTVMTKQTLDKLRTAFGFGCPDREACIFAGIDQKTLYNYCKKNPDFSIEKEELKDNPVIIARAVVFEALSKKRSTPDAWEYLKRKRKLEFSDAKINTTPDEMMSVDDLEAINSGDIKKISSGSKK